LIGCYLQQPHAGDHSIYQQPQTGEPTEPTENEPPPATVSGGTGTLPAPTPNYLSPETKVSMYTYAKMECRYFNLPCRAQMPLTARPNDASPTCAVAWLGLPQGRREIRVDFERVGDWPELPKPLDTYVDGGLAGVLLQYWDKILPPALAADFNQTVYRIEAYYLYALNRPVNKNDYTRTGVLPQTAFTQENNLLQRDKYYTERMLPGNDIPTGS
jgi:hypothetical protein